MRLEHFWEAHLVQNMPFLTSKFWFFLIHCHVLSVWVAESWKCSKFGHDRRLGNFTRENILSDEYLSRFLPDCKVLWMTLEQLFEIFIKIIMFDCSRARFVLLWGQNQLLVPSESGKARKTSNFSQESCTRSHLIDQKRSESYINNMPRSFSCENQFGFIICHLIAKSIGTCTEMDPWLGSGKKFLRF